MLSLSATPVQVETHAASSGKGSTESQTVEHGRQQGGDVLGRREEGGQSGDEEGGSSYLRGKANMACH